MPVTRLLGCSRGPGAVEEGVALASRSAVKTGTSCARAVAMWERMRQKALSPRMLRQLPLIFAWILAILMACSQLLLVQSTSKSMLKYSTWSIRLAIRLASLWASLLAPLTPGALAATPCSAVLAYRPRSWPRVAGGRLDAPA